MAVSLNRTSAKATVPLYIAPCRLYLTADDRVVGEGNTDAQSLLVRVGGTIPLADAIRYGLVAPAPAQPTDAEEQAHESMVESFRPAPEA